MDLLAGRAASAGHQAPAARKFVVYEEREEAGQECNSGGAVSTFTFLNFLAASLTLTATVSNNNNNNNNNNNDNNNNNNNNNINIGNNNNNANSANTLTFLPMVGKRSAPSNSSVSEICTRQVVRMQRV